MAKLPRISIVIPSLNKEKYIGETLRSIVLQEYPDLELIIQDAGSTDGSLKIIKKYVEKYKWIRYELKKGQTQVDAINYGLSKATGEIVSYINADDMYTNGALLEIGKTFSKYPKAKWAAGKGRVVNSKGELIAPAVTVYKNFLLKLNKYHLLLMVNYLMQPSVFVKRDTYKKYGPFDGSNGTVLEYGLWLKIGKHSMPKVINQALSKFRLVEGTISMKNAKQISEEDLKLVKKYTKNPFLLSLHYLNNYSRILIGKST